MRLGRVEQSSPMSEQDEYTPIQRIKKSQENTVVALGVAIGFVLLLYFFSFAAMVDAGNAMAWFQAITTALMAVMLVFLKHIAFWLTRLRLGRRAEFRDVFASLTPSDLDGVTLN